MRKYFAPRGHDSLAQAEGLGIWSHHIASPNWATVTTGITSHATILGKRVVARCLQYETSFPIPRSKGIARGYECIHGRHAPQYQLPLFDSKLCRRSFALFVSTFPHDYHCKADRGNEDFVFIMDQDAITRIKRFLLAIWLRRVLRKSIERRSGKDIHRQPGGTSSEADVSRRVPRVPSSTRHRMGRTLRLGVSIAWPTRSVFDPKRHDSIDATNRFIELVLAPKGNDSKAQANGLGLQHNQIASPNGATFDQRGLNDIVPVNAYPNYVRDIESRPVGAWWMNGWVCGSRPVTQGVALGYRMPPRWGQDSIDTIARTARDSIVATNRLVEPAFAPTGHDSKAQANGLGTRSNHIVSPNGATFVYRAPNDITSVMRDIESRPVGAACLFRPVTQGVALGYRMPPRWGRDHNIAVGGLCRAYELFGDKLIAILDELNMRLAA